MQQHFQNFAVYKQWANARLYAAASALTEADYRRPAGLSILTAKEPSSLDMVAFQRSRPGFGAS
jgi:uncharacterized damage-inducible protein DinB